MTSTWRSGYGRAKRRVVFHGEPARICWLDHGDQTASRCNGVVVAGELSTQLIPGRDHLDHGSVAAPYPETGSEGRLVGCTGRLAAAERSRQYRFRGSLSVVAPRRRGRYGKVPARWAGNTSPPGPGWSRAASRGYWPTIRRRACCAMWTPVTNVRTVPTEPCHSHTTGFARQHDMTTARPRACEMATQSEPGASGW